MILCIETSTDICSVAITIEGEQVSNITLTDGRQHSSQVAPMIQRCVHEAGVSRGQLQAIAISNGPGSYTGLRVGASTAKGLCYGLDIPLISVPSLQMMATEHADQDTAVMGTIDARRMEAYTAVYRGDNELRPTQSTIWTSEIFDALIQEYGDLIICGNGIEKALSSIDIPPGIRIIPSQANASKMCGIATKKFAQKDFVDVAYHSPLYYKSPNITTPKRKQQVL